MRSKAAKEKVSFGKSSRFKLIVKSDMTLANKTKLFIKIYGKSLSNLPIFLVLVALAVVFLVPFLYMIGHSLMTVDDILNPNIKWLPRSFNISNYQYAFRSLNYFYYLGKTILVVGLAVIGQVVSSAFVAYGLARVRFKGSGAIFALVIFMLIVPPQTIIVPSYILYSDNFFGWLDTFLPIVVPCFFSMGLNGGLMVFIFRQFFRGMPAELENAALIDGTGIFGAYFRVIFPNAAPAILTCSILSMVWQWNNSFETSIYIRELKNGLLPAQLRALESNLNNISTGVNFNEGINMAATFLSVLPILIIFFALQGRFMKNMANSGLAN